MDVPKGLPFIPDELQPKLELVSRKTNFTKQEELESNNRAHSAKLRVARKIHKWEEEMSEKRPNPLQDQMRKFSRVEKAFYGSIVLTAIILAVSIVFMQTKLLQVDQDLTEVNTQIEAEQTELADIKQEVNELTRYERLSPVSQLSGYETPEGNRKTVSSTDEE